MPEPPTDEQLLSRFAKGDDEALGTLAERYEPALLGLAAAVLSGRNDLARDAVQDAWVRVIKSARHFAGRSTVKTWLYRIVINRCLDLRQKLAAPRLNGDSHTVHETPLAAAAGNERLDRLRGALDTLSGESRLLVLLCYHEGLGHAAAADVLGIPIGTLKSRLHAALTQLRAALPSEVHV